MGVNEDQVPRFPATEVGAALGESVEFLGRGAFGDTWRAASTAVKIICHDSYPEPRLRREVEGLSRVQSPFVVNLLTFSLPLGGMSRPTLRFEYRWRGAVPACKSATTWPARVGIRLFTG
jgi:hypothetical protein